MLLYFIAGVVRIVALVWCVTAGSQREAGRKGNIQKEFRRGCGLASALRGSWWSSAWRVQEIMPEKGQPMLSSPFKNVYSYWIVLIYVLYDSMFVMCVKATWLHAAYDKPIYPIHPGTYDGLFCSLLISFAGCSAWSTFVSVTAVVQLASIWGQGDEGPER